MAWALCEWARDPFSTVLMIFVFSSFFVENMMSDPIHAQIIWGYSLSLMSGLVAVLSPLFGAVASQLRTRKPIMAVLVTISFFCCISLQFITAGEFWHVFPFLLAFVVGGVCVHLVQLLTDAMLSSVASPDRIGWLSGVSTALGQFGGLAALFLLWLISQLDIAHAFGFNESHLVERLSAPIVGVWLAAFYIPFFLFTREQPKENVSGNGAISHGFQELLSTFRNLRRYKNVVMFLLARVAYWDGIIAFYSFVAIYGTGLFSWTGSELIILALCFQFSAIVGGMAAAYLDQKLGAKGVVLTTIAGMIFSAVSMALITPTGVLGLKLSGSIPYLNLSLEIPEVIFIGVCAISGICLGANLGASRSLMAILAPEDLKEEFFGFYSMVGRATTFLGPLLIGVVSEISGDRRIGIFGVVVVLMGVGFITMSLVRGDRCDEEHVLAHSECT